MLVITLKQEMIYDVHPKLNKEGKSSSTVSRSDHEDRSSSQRNYASSQTPFVFKKIDPKYLQIMSESPKKVPNCSVCPDKSTKEMLQCNYCESWYHYKCEIINHHIYKYHFDRPKAVWTFEKCQIIINQDRTQKERDDYKSLRNLAESKNQELLRNGDRDHKFVVKGLRLVKIEITAA